jgi:hypothetical protein
MDKLIDVRIGEATIDPSIPSTPDSSWLSVPVSYIANSDAVREWKNKFAQIADKQNETLIPVSCCGGADRQCGTSQFAGRPLVDGAKLFGAANWSFLSDGMGMGRDLQSVAICFASVPTAGGFMGQCFGKRIISASFGGLSDAYRDVQCKSNGGCLNFEARAAAIKLDIQFLDAPGTVVYDLRLPFIGNFRRPSFPDLHFSNSRIRPSGADTVFQNFCIRPQGPFFS